MTKGIITILSEIFPHFSFSFFSFPTFPYILRTLQNWASLYAQPTQTQVSTTAKSSSPIRCCATMPQDLLQE
ncbi:Histone-lysine N-methyltransferase EZH1 [Fusarium oxysporum f. sp. albedinis]|nr:Histone-lysine N-methyltransferase EZH1 [Fusarium oxysporum f. sp. albedinis]